MHRPFFITLFCFDVGLMKMRGGSFCGCDVNERDVSVPEVIPARQLTGNDHGLASAEVGVSNREYEKKEKRNKENNLELQIFLSLLL